MSVTSELPPIDPGDLVPWRVLDPNVVVGEDWVLPTRRDVENARSGLLVTPPEALGLQPQIVTPDEVATGGLNRALEKMHAGIGNGLGIAAVQVGEPYDVVGIRTETGKLTMLTGVCFEPDLAAHEEAKVRAYGPWGIEAEGCLTLPAPIIAHPLRYLAGTLIADLEIVPQLDKHGKVTSVETKVWEPVEINDLPGQRISVARIAQHEADHMEGWLFADRVYSQEYTTPDKHLLTGAVHWVHGEHYDAYVAHLLKIREVLKGTMRYEDLPELHLSTLPYEQYRALRAGQIVLPRPEDLLA